MAGACFGRLGSVSLSSIFTVGELTANIKSSLEKNFPVVWVKGEVSNLSRPSSGHVYFSLKDSDALLHCVWFKNTQRPLENFDPMTGEVYEDGPRPSLAQTMKNGQEILCMGNVSVYASRGSYQLSVTYAQESGRGVLYAAFEALKIKLLAAGYFASERKRALPYNPQRVAVITSSQGAAIHDFLRIAQTRGTGSCIRIHPVPVQGDAAAPAIVKALQEVVEQGWAEVIVLIRGGGSLEDLWAFNEEIVAEAVYMSPVPVLAGIGHEVDSSMTDMTADVRAATPTHAAQLLWPDRQELMQKVDGLHMAIHEAGQSLLQEQEQRLTHHEQALRWLSPLQAWQRKEELLHLYTQRLSQYAWQYVEFQERQVQSYAQVLPCVERRLEEGQRVLETAQMRLEHAGQRSLSQKERDFETLTQDLPRSMRSLEEQYHHALHALTLQLQAVNPLAPLERGYALLQKTGGEVVRSIDDVALGQDIHMQVADGCITATVNHKKAFSLVSEKE